MEWGLWSKGTQIQGVGQGKVETQKQDQTGGKTQGDMPGKREGRTERAPESPRDSHQGGGQGGSWAFRRGTEREQETYSDTEVPEAKSEVLPDSRSTSGTPYKLVGAGGGPRERSGQGAGKGVAQHTQVSQQKWVGAGLSSVRQTQALPVPLGVPSGGPQRTRGRGAGAWVVQGILNLSVQTALSPCPRTGSCGQRRSKVKGLEKTEVSRRVAIGGASAGL